jgi:hypothetical protein
MVGIIVALRARCSGAVDLAAFLLISHLLGRHAVGGGHVPQDGMECVVINWLLAANVIRRSIA